MRHSTVNELLYEYLNDELAPSVRDEVSGHLAGCGECRQECDELRAALTAFPRASLNPAASLPESYWSRFAARVEEKIESDHAGVAGPATLPRRRTSFSFSGLVDHFMFTPRPYLTVFAGALGVVIVVLTAWRWFAVVPPVPTETAGEYLTDLPVMRAADDSTNRRLYQYISRSKTLLVGVSNMKPVNASSYDLSVEQAKSKQLIREARYLQEQPIDPRAQRLIADLERILIELANIKEKGNVPNVEILRGGLHQENLLFKIRMEEKTFAFPRDTSAGDQAHNL